MKSLEPKQERSRKTLQKLLEATITVLDSHGLDGTTVPRIAQKARVSPASVYRRFPDKDALIEAALLSALEGSVQAVTDSYDPVKFAKLPIRKALAIALGAIFEQNRSHPKLVIALKRFAELRPSFQEATKELMESNFHAMIVALSSCPDVKGVRDKDKRIKFALLTAATAIEVMILEPVSFWSVMSSESDEKMLARHIEMFLAYLNS